MTEPIERKRAERDYSKGIIYKLCCNDLNVKEIYIGSTTNFKNRKRSHKSDCNNKKSKIYNLRVYQYIRSNGDWDNWSMILVENYNATDQRHLEARERYWIETLNTTLNCRVPLRSEKEIKEYHHEYDKEYYEDNKTKIKEKSKLYRTENKTKVNEKKNEIIICECGIEYARSNKARHIKSQRHIKQITLLHSSEPTSTTEILS